MCLDAWNQFLFKAPTRDTLKDVFQKKKNKMFARYRICPGARERGEGVSDQGMVHMHQQILENIHTVSRGVAYAFECLAELLSYVVGYVFSCLFSCIDYFLPESNADPSTSNLRQMVMCVGGFLGVSLVLSFFVFTCIASTCILRKNRRIYFGKHKQWCSIFVFTALLTVGLTLLLPLASKMMQVSSIVLITECMQRELKHEEWMPAEFTHAEPPALYVRGRRM